MSDKKDRKHKRSKSVNMRRSDTSDLKHRDNLGIMQDIYLGDEPDFMDELGDAGSVGNVGSAEPQDTETGVDTDDIDFDIDLGAPPPVPFEDTRGFLDDLLDRELELLRETGLVITDTPRAKQRPRRSKSQSYVDSRIQQMISIDGDDAIEKSDAEIKAETKTKKKKIEEIDIPANSYGNYRRHRRFEQVNSCERFNRVPPRGRRQD